MGNELWTEDASVLISVYTIMLSQQKNIKWWPWMKILLPFSVKVRAPRSSTRSLRLSDTTRGVDAHMGGWVAG